MSALGFLPTSASVRAFLTTESKVAELGAGTSPSRSTYWSHVIDGAVKVTWVVESAVMGRFASLTSFLSRQAVSPTRPLLVTVVCAADGAASTASRKKVANLVRGGGFQEWFHGSPLKLEISSDDYNTFRLRSEVIFKLRHDHIFRFAGIW